MSKQAPLFKKRAFRAEWNGLVVINSDVFINERLYFKDGLRLVNANAFGFENGKEIFGHGMSYGLARLDMDGVMPYCNARIKKHPSRAFLNGCLKNKFICWASYWCLQ